MTFQSLYLSRKELCSGAAGRDACFCSSIRERSLLGVLVY